MRSKGMARKIDPLGRVVLPVELRETLDIKKGDALEIFIDGEKIVLRKYEPGCIFCGGMIFVRTFHEKHICSICRDQIKSCV